MTTSEATLVAKSVVFFQVQAIVKMYEAGLIKANRHLSSSSLLATCCVVAGIKYEDAIHFLGTMGYPAPQD